jgi:GNAT superfamily N-acetyltransferase
VQTRIAVRSDAAVLVGVWSQIRHVGARAERAVNPLTVADAEQRLAEVVDNPYADVIIASDGTDVAGLAVVRVVQPDPLSPTRVLQLSNIVVADQHRRRGVGHALVAAAAEYADSRGVDHVAAGVYPSLREANRFFARLGFAPVTTERIAPVTGLQRRLGVAALPARIDGRIRRRRMARPRALASQRRAATRGTD